MVMIANQNNEIINLTGNAFEELFMVELIGTHRLSSIVAAHMPFERPAVILVINHQTHWQVLLPRFTLLDV